MLYQVATSILLQSLIYLALCLIIPIGELGFTYTITGFPPHLITTPTLGDLPALHMATYAFAITHLGMAWSRQALKKKKHPNKTQFLNKTTKPADPD